MTQANFMLFLKKFMNNPKQVGSISPSSRFLARKMVQSVPWHQVRNVAELGSGTGAITSWISSYVYPETNVFLFEKEGQMRSQLQRKYAGFACHSDACQLTTTISRYAIDQLDCIISGLPFFNFERNLRETLMKQIKQALKPDGHFVAFQYSLQMKTHFMKYFDIEKISFVPFNVPPAFVYVCRKRAKDGEL
ncbi:class I SAM-dependent methyltransferase [Paenibacillus roseipurpureus]|uniref:Methyltransferase domain-containing protein n=1 Tax=Paenibacillus roseopurpureus TaxID=2918901 RepID=A0AA96RJI3_9BACL|nr:methyltransferase domain-containing protein [Paenibacillus sp. MBLB1832]WNR43339.1 methyltransferase domain-containing protein [Paenibacillus sp. MBLB1832]